MGKFKPNKINRLERPFLAKMGFCSGLNYDLPKKIKGIILSEPSLNKSFGDTVAAKSLNVSEMKISFNSEFENWIIREGQFRNSEIKRYLHYLAVMSDIFNNIARFFNKNNKGMENEEDRFTLGTSPLEMLYIARYLYYLDSYSVEGDVLECGCFKGFSSCCLSWACDFLGKKLIIADSFEGLPESEYKNERRFFKKHDYKGELNEVKENIKTLGKIDSVEFVPGWFNESLANFNNALCLIWMDVDLYQSALDVLNNVYNNLTQDGVIFSHEFNEIQVKNGIIKDQTKKNVLKAINDFFKSTETKYKAKHLIKRTGIVVASADGNILLSKEKQNLLLELIDDRQRILHENQMYTDEIMLAIDILKKIPFVEQIIKCITNSLIRKKFCS